MKVSQITDLSIVCSKDYLCLQQRKSSKFHITGPLWGESIGFHHVGPVMQKVIYYWHVVRKCCVTIFFNILFFLVGLQWAYDVHRQPNCPRSCSGSPASGWTRLCRRELLSSSGFGRTPQWHVWASLCRSHGGEPGGECSKNMWTDPQRASAAASAGRVGSPHQPG